MSPGRHGLRGFSAASIWPTALRTRRRKSFSPISAVASSGLPVAPDGPLPVHLLLWAFALVDNLRHSHVWISYGGALNRWLISPAHHQLHHSAEPQHRGRNRGFELAVWDRIYGTLYVPSHRKEEFRIGLGDGTDGRWHTVGRLYFWPFALLAKRLLNRVRRPGLGPGRV